MVTIAAFDNLEQAELLRSQLEECGIQGFVADSAVVALNWMYSNAVGGIKVQVAEEDVDKAREVLQELGQPLPDAAPLSPYTCPHCGSTKVEFRRISKAFFMLSLLVLSVPLAFYRPHCKCLDCGQTWKR